MKTAVDSFWTYVFLNIVALIFSLWWFCFRNSYANYVILISVSFQYLISRYREDKETVGRREKWDKQWRNIGSHGQPRALARAIPLCRLVRPGFEPWPYFQSIRQQPGNWMTNMNFIDWWLACGRQRAIKWRHILVKLIGPVFWKRCL